MKSERVQEILNDINGRRVLVIGDVMLDEFVWGNARRIAPEAPVPVVEVTRETKHLGGAANVAANIISLGAIPLVVGIIGNDSNGGFLKDEFYKLGLLQQGLIVDTTRPTTTKTRIIAHSQQVVRVDREFQLATTPEIEKQLVKISLELMTESDAIIISDYDKGVITPSLLETILFEAQKQNLPVSVDPKLKNFPFYKPITVITPNHHEAEAITQQKIISDQSLIAIGNQLRKMLGNANVLITRGEEGMSLFSSKEDIFHIPTVAHEVFDVTGAGDSVVAMLTLALTANATIKEASILSNHTAGIVVGKIGTATALPSEVLKTFV